MVDRINNNQITHIFERNLNKANKKGQQTNSKPVQDMVNLESADIIDKAKETPKINTEKVENAKKLLENGQLETKKNFREAAENILKYGI